MNWREFLHLDTKHPHPNGYALPSLIGLLSLISIAILTALNRSATDIQILQAEKNMTHAFSMAENHLIVAEKALLDGRLRTDLIRIETFQPKGFRKRPNIATTHYQLTATAYRHQTKIEIQTIIRIHEKQKSSNTPTTQGSPNRTMERVSWKII